MDPQELPILANIYVVAIKSAIPGAVPDRLRNDFSMDRALRRLGEVLAMGAQQPFCYVGQMADKIAGFIIGSLAEHPSMRYQGELKVLYILPDYQRLGLGRTLVYAAVNHFLQMSVNSMFVEMFQDNIPAGKFYQSLGGILIGERSDTIHGERCTMSWYGWPSISHITPF